MKECICGNYPANVMSIGNQMICEDCSDKIEKCQFNEFTLKIISNAGFKVFRVYWIGDFKPTDMIGIEIEDALRVAGYTKFASYWMDRYEILKA